ARLVPLVALQAMRTASRFRDGGGTASFGGDWFLPHPTSHLRWPMRTSVAMLAFVTACSSAHNGMSMNPSSPSAYSNDVQAAYARVRAATASFHVVDSAVAKGYAAPVARCLFAPKNG